MPAAPSAGTAGRSRRHGIDRLPILAAEAIRELVGLVAEDDSQGVDGDGSRIGDAADAEAAVTARPTLGLVAGERAEADGPRAASGVKHSCYSGEQPKQSGSLVEAWL
jgi:hypothetical protein